jgi:hypothetical protein
MSITYTLKLESIGDETALVFPADFVAQQKLAVGDFVYLEENDESLVLNFVNINTDDESL